VSNRLHLLRLQLFQKRLESPSVAATEQLARARVAMLGADEKLLGTRERRDAPECSEQRGKYRLEVCLKVRTQQCDVDQTAGAVDDVTTRAPDVEVR
jgi:hypothetical protein